MTVIYQSLINSPDRNTSWWRYQGPTPNPYRTFLGQGFNNYNGSAFLYDDDNHVRGGAGRVQLMAIADAAGVNRPASGSSVATTGCIPLVDLRGATFTLDLESKNLERPSVAKIGFWIQGRSHSNSRGLQGRMLNLLLKDSWCSALPLLQPENHYPMPANTVPVTGFSSPMRRSKTLTLSVNPDAWIDMGSSYEFLDTYGWLDSRNPQGDVEEILDGGFVDLGIVCLMDAWQTGRLRGEFTFHEFRIEN